MSKHLPDPPTTRPTAPRRGPDRPNKGGVAKRRPQNRQSGKAPSASGQPAQERPGRPGRPRSAGKHAAIIDAAGALFLANGFDRTTMDAVAERAGVSKQTVYSHFDNKAALFQAVVRQVRLSYLSDLPAVAGDPRPLPERLTAVGRQFVRLITSNQAVAMFRVLVAQSGAGTDEPPAPTHRSDGHSPGVPRGGRQSALYYEAGPMMLIDGIRRVMTAALAAGDLEGADADRITMDFVALLKGDVHMRRVLGLPVDLSDAAVEAHAVRCVETLLRAYRPASSPSAAISSARMGDIK
ncbi:TetR/AcrR family transcriptional regulator [Rhodothalassium salexigens]|uniref:TetR/AcrR family transcriptional regulator n=1 Tax=Rhodothalassium salexigens TaxID=1086 RepID=UPI0019120219|nr:TetR/AcrR family transcriptional regulator [Rhodothalassium salexigens]